MNDLVVEKKYFKSLTIILRNLGCIAGAIGLFALVLILAL
jgi:hypothetical protein